MIKAILVMEDADSTGIWCYSPDERRGLTRDEAAALIEYLGEIDDDQLAELCDE